MVSEAALCLLLDLDLIQEDKSRRVLKTRNGSMGFAGKLEGGILTPATSMGFHLIDRLNNNGFSFKLTNQ